MPRARTVPGHQRHATEWITGLPTVTNADTLWRAAGPRRAADQQLGRICLSPEFKGKAALQDGPAVGSIDVALALEARGKFKYVDKAT